MGFQSSMNAVVGTVATANKVKDIAPGGGKTNFGEMNSMMAFQKSNQGLVEEYTKKKSNLERSKNALTKMGRWTEKQDEMMKFYDSQIEKYQNVGKAVGAKIESQISKLAEEGAKDAIQ